MQLYNGVINCRLQTLKFTYEAKCRETGYLDRWVSGNNLRIHAGSAVESDYGNMGYSAALNVPNPLRNNLRIQAGLLG